MLLLNAAMQSAVRAAKNLRSRICKPSTSNMKDSHFSHPTYADLAPFHGAIAENSSRNIFLPSACVSSVCMDLCDSMSEKINLTDRLGGRISVSM